MSENEQKPIEQKTQTGSGALTEKAQKSQRPLLIYHPPEQDDWLSFWEVVLVTLLGIFILFAMGGAGLWIFSGEPQEIAERFAKFLDVINRNWKVCLVIIIPLTFRPLRIFLENLKRFGLLESERQTQKPEPKPVPPKK